MEVRYTQNEHDGVDLAYTVLGEGPREIAIVPGFVSHLELLWGGRRPRRFLDRLCSFARVIIWDKREQGLSGRTGRPPTLEQSKDDLLAVLAAAGSERPSLLGISEGGPMSLLFAAVHPDRVASLVLFGTYCRLVRSEDFEVGIEVEKIRKTIDRIAADFAASAGFRYFAPSVQDDPELSELWGRVMRSGTSPTGLRELMSLYEQIDLREIMPSVHAPALVLHPAEDRLIPIGLGRDLDERLPNSRLVELEGTDHLFYAGDVSRLERLCDEIEEFLTGRRRARAVDRILTTVLFTDMVGSTERAAELGDARWRELLARHHEIVRAELGRHQGREVGTAGDGFVASFDGPARAVRCAEAIIARTGAEEIPLRAGIHTGECELIEGDLAGLAVHIGARIGELAEPGEILVSGTVRDLVVGSELEFAERGEHELRGVPGSWRLFRLDAAPAPV